MFLGDIEEMEIDKGEIIGMDKESLGAPGVGSQGTQFPNATEGS